MGYREDLLKNLEAIRRAKFLVDNKIKPTEHDFLIINSFTSWGNFKELLYPHNLDWQFLTTSKSVLSREKATKEFIQGLEELFPEEFPTIYENIKSSIPTSFYTDPSIVKGIFDRIDKETTVNSFLDPCVGGGIFIDEFIKRYPDVPKANIYALDIDSIATLLISAKYPEINVINEGFEKFKAPISFDLISSNIPFANERVYDEDILIPNATDKVHNYFFYKSTKLLSDNGILQLITTGGLINSKSNQRILSEISKDLSPTLIVPLSTEAFKGTEVNAYYLEGIKDGNPDKKLLDDIIRTEDGILLNRAIKRDDFDLIVYKSPYGNPEYALNGKNVDTLEYFSLQPQLQFKSTFSGKERIAEFYIKENLFGKILKDNFNNRYLISKGEEPEVWLSGKEFKENITVFYSQLLRSSQSNKNNVKIVSNNDGFIEYFNKTYFEKYAKEIKLIVESQSINIKDTQYHNSNIIQGELVKINDDYYKLSNDQFIKQSDIDESKYNAYYSLKKAYKKYLLSPEERNIRNLENVYNFFIENRYQENITELDSFALFVKSLSTSDIFRKESENSSLTAKESLYRVLNEKDTFSLEDLKVNCELSEDEILSGLSDLIIFNPLIDEYQQKDYFLSGNLYQLVENVQALAGDHSELISEIKANFPERIHYPEIKLQFGTRWLDTKHIIDFINKKYNCTFSIQYDSQTDFFVVSANTFSELYRNESFGTLGNRYIHAEDVISNAFFHTYPIITYSEVINGDRVTYTDTNSTELLKRKIDTLRDEFSQHMNNISQEDKDQIEEYYNRTRNLKPYIPNGNHLTFDELDLAAVGISEINAHQKAAAWKNVVNSGGLTDHEVGLGKTLTMIIEAYLLKKIGKARKPMILGLPANYGDIKTEYEKIIPNAKILFLDNTKNFSPNNRQETILKIANENWDVIIGSHSQFKMFKMPANKEIEHIEKSIENCKNNLFSIKNDSGLTSISKKQLLGLEKKIKSLELKLELKLDNIGKGSEDNILTFDQMGIDHLIVDESHIFKNLDLETRHERVAGLSAQGSERSLNLLIGAEVIREKKGIENYGISLYSGTPIANQLAESYTLMKYMIPGVLKDMSIHNFDSWASNFIIKATEYEVNTVGSIVSKERFRYYINVPDLAAIYGSFTDIMTGEMANIDRPKAREKLIITPELSSQRRFMKKLERFLMTGDSSNLGLEKPLNMEKGSLAKSIVAMNLAAKASLDMRLINSKFKDDPKSKVNEVTRQLIQHYKEFDDIRSTQIAFIDASTPKQSFTEKRIREQMGSGVFNNVYDDIAGKLLNAGIKASEIAYIHDYSTPTKKVILNRKMNAGEIRILLGSTEKAGTGLNVQKRLMRILNVTFPWRPSDLKQRTGRTVRQGNEYAKLYNNNCADILTFATEKTFDNLKINTVANKGKFISQLKEATINKNIGREIDEGAIDENTGMSLAEFQAQISGDNSLLEYTKVNKQVEDMIKEKRDIENGKMIINSKIATTEKEIISRGRAIEFIDNLLTANTSDSIEIPVYYEVKDVNEKNLKVYYEELEESTIVGGVEKCIAEYKGFKLYHTLITEENSGLYDENHHQYKIIKDNYSFMIADGGRNGASINHFQNIINGLARRNDKNKEFLNKEERKVYELKSIPSLEWDENKEMLLDSLKLEKTTLERKLSERQEYLKELEPKIVEGYRLIDTLDKFQYAIENDVLGSEGNGETFNITDEVYKAMDKLNSQDVGFYAIPTGVSESGDYKTVNVIVEDYNLLNSEIDYSIFQSKSDLEITR
ncbi:hypothetical protein LPB90_18510 [Chryseobacterium sp. LC2016-29]|uniref:helicase-related protein n=1 Tax=Chryseobacterium sp. LC2016-29 TaxID=2897331 RepID=UPI001E45A1F0|nr:helicase-related protein [Chryseobacterium sp. LC2016-29]MCD0480436.1 hypothetical protein [Chryseobacterium sp. LC2016-29]